MARTVRVHLIDDLDGSSADETVKFSVDGVDYEIDLNSEHGDALRRAVAPFIVAGRRATRGIITGRRTTRGAAPAPLDRGRNHAIRAWAAEAGIELSGRGRIPADVVERYEKESGH